MRTTRGLIAASLTVLTLAMLGVTISGTQTAQAYSINQLQPPIVYTQVRGGVVTHDFCLPTSDGHTHAITFNPGYATYGVTEKWYFFDMFIWSNGLHTMMFGHALLNWQGEVISNTWLPLGVNQIVLDAATHYFNFGPLPCYT